MGDSTHRCRTRRLSNEAALADRPAGWVVEAGSGIGSPPCGGWVSAAGFLGFGGRGLRSSPCSSTISSEIPSGSQAILRGATPYQRLGDIDPSVFEGQAEEWVARTPPMVLAAVATAEVLDDRDSAARAARVAAVSAALMLIGIGLWRHRTSIVAAGSATVAAASFSQNLV